MGWLFRVLSYSTNSVHKITTAFLNIFTAANRTKYINIHFSPSVKIWIDTLCRAHLNVTEYYMSKTSSWKMSHFACHCCFLCATSFFVWRWGWCWIIWFLDVSTQCSLGSCLCPQALCWIPISITLTPASLNSIKLIQSDKSHNVSGSYW